MTKEEWIIYDNGGRSADRYTILIEPASGLFGRQGLWECLGLSDNPDHPQQGFSQCGLALPGDHLGEIISFEDLPENVRLHIIERLGLEEVG